MDDVSTEFNFRSLVNEQLITAAGLRLCELTERLAQARTDETRAAQAIETTDRAFAAATVAGDAAAAEAAADAHADAVTRAKLLSRGVGALELAVAEFKMKASRPPPRRRGRRSRHGRARKGWQRRRLAMMPSRCWPKRPRGRIAPTARCSRRGMSRRTTRPLHIAPIASIPCCSPGCRCRLPTRRRRGVELETVTRRIVPGPAEPVLADFDAVGVWLRTLSPERALAVLDAAQGIPAAGTSGAAGAAPAAPADGRAAGGTIRSTRVRCEFGSNRARRRAGRLTRQPTEGTPE